MTEFDPDVYERARKRVAEVKGFYMHLGIYAIFSAAFVAINLITSPHRHWFWWPVLGWGVAVVIHAFSFFVENRWLGSEWEQRKMREFVSQQSHDVKTGR